MAVIHVLDKHTAELIAAGEVVERPASVVKELLENSIDAGASQITVSIESGGVKLIEISDNGTGIEAEYISTAFIRHATSKIQTPDDLVSIHTLGFRGEALASIASVARVELTTRTEQDEFATVYCIEGGEELSREPGARAVGTTIRVQDLFYNTPARMKFLKKDSSEGTFVADTVTHVALSHPEVSIKFIREGKLQYVTPGDGQLRGAAYSVLGREFSRDLVEVDNQEGVYHIRGLITAQELPRQPQHAAFLHQWTLCPQPYHHGRYGDGVQGHHDAGQVPWRHPAAGYAGRPGRCECAPGQDRGALCPGKRHLRCGLPCRQAGTGPARHRRAAFHL